MRHSKLEYRARPNAVLILLKPPTDSFPSNSLTLASTQTHSPACAPLPAVRVARLGPAPVGPALGGDDSIGYPLFSLAGGHINDIESLA